MKASQVDPFFGQVDPEMRRQVMDENKVRESALELREMNRALSALEGRFMLPENAETIAALEAFDGRTREQSLEHFNALQDTLFHAYQLQCRRLGVGLDQLVALQPHQRDDGRS